MNQEHNNKRTHHRILVIDDNPDIHHDFRKVLCEDRASSSALEAAEASLFGDINRLGKQYEFEIDSAFQGEHGLARVYHALQEDHPYEIVFLDVRMPPGWDGIEVAPRLWQADPDLQIVICTAYSDYTWEEMFARVGTSDRMFILKKPFEREEVLQFAHTLVEKRRLFMQAKTRDHQVIAEQVQALESTSEKFKTEIFRLKQSGESSEPSGS